MNKYQLKLKDHLYYARIIANSGIYDVCELIIRTITNDYFVGIDKMDKHAYLCMIENLLSTKYNLQKMGREK